MQENRHQKEGSRSPDGMNSSFEDQSFDVAKQKSELFAKLNEMKKAIDGYKDLKTKAQSLNRQESLTNQSEVVVKNEQSQIKEIEKENMIVSSPENQSFCLSKSSSALSMHRSGGLTGQRGLSRNETVSQYKSAQSSQRHLMFIDKKDQFEDFKSITLKLSQTDEFNNKNLQQYLNPFSPTFNQQQLGLPQITTSDIDIQCDIDFHMQTEFITKHREQLQFFESQLCLLKDQLSSQQVNESKLRYKMDQMSEEIQQLISEKQESQLREENLLRQTEDLVQVVEDQTVELRDRDRLIQDLREIENKYYDLSSSLQEQQQQNVNLKAITDEFNKQKAEQQLQIQDLQEKLAAEFSKKRKMKQDYDQQMCEQKEELEYYKEKYNDMKELLNNCKEQLKQFEELNEMRNVVIERLENENMQMKKLQQQNNFGLLSSITSGQNTARKFNTFDNCGSSVVQTPAKPEDKSFSLNLQQVNCDMSDSKQSRISQDKGNNSILPQEKRRSMVNSVFQSEKKNNLNHRINMYDGYVQNHKRNFQGGVFSDQLTTPKNGLAQQSMIHERKTSANNSYMHPGYTRNHQIIDYERDQLNERSMMNMGANNSRSRMNYNSLNNEYDSKTSNISRNEIEDLPRQESLQSLHYQQSLTGSISQYDKQYQQKIKQELSNCISPEQEYKVSFNELQSPQYQTEAKQGGDHQFRFQQVQDSAKTCEKENYIIRVKMLNESLNESKQREIGQEQGTPRLFRVLTNENNDSLGGNKQQRGRAGSKQPFDYRTQQESLKCGNSIQSSCTFAEKSMNETYAHDTQSIITNENFNQYAGLQESVTSKTSIKDEIKKLHNNINSLRQKMNIPVTKNSKDKRTNDSLIVNEEKNYINMPNERQNRLQ